MVSVLTIFLKKRVYLVDNIGYLLMKVSKDLKYQLTKQLKQYDLTASQWAVLKRIEIEELKESSPDKRTAAVIAGVLDLDKPTISGIINRLYEKDMVRKLHHPKDKRAVILCLTEKSRLLIPTIEGISNGVIEKALSLVSEQERGILVGLLNKMDQVLEEEDL